VDTNRGQWLCFPLDAALVNDMRVATQWHQAIDSLTKISPNWGTLMTYATVFGRWPSIHDLEERLRTLNRTDAVRVVAWCNASTHTWQLIRDNALDQRVRDLVFPFWKAQFQRWTEHYGEGFVFHRYTLPCLLRHVLVMCPPDSGARLNSSERVATLGEALLMSNDLSAFASPKPLPTDLAVAANMLPNTEYFSQEDYDREIARMVPK